MINRKLSSKIITGLFAVMVSVAGVQGVRAKEDTSSVYIHCTEYEGNDCGFDAYAYGCDNYNGDGSQCFSGRNSIYYGTELKMINYIKENNKDYAYIKANLKDYDAVYYGGLWSPDSI